MSEPLVSSGLRLGVPLPAWLAVVIACAIVAMVVVGLREHRTLRDARRRTLLDVLRVLSAALALLLLLQPQWVGEEVEQVEGRIAVLVDASRSMSVAEDGETRWSKVATGLERALSRAKHKPALYEFGAELTPMPRAKLSEAAPALQDETRIEHALRALLSADTELGAVLLASDGADEAAARSVDTLRSLGVRVHTLAVGKDEALDDASIESLEADGVAFLRQPAQVQVRVRVPPSRSGPLTVTLRKGAEVIRETDVEIGPDGTGVVGLSFTPTKLGRSVYTVSIPTQAGDAVPENDQRAFLVRVVRDKLRALLVCGSPSWDARFLRALLKGNPAIDLITFYILRTQNDNSMAPPEELSLIPFPTEELFEQHLSSFDLVIFQDFDFGPYQMGRYLPRIRDYVMNGGSFAMLGGSRSFGAGGYFGTPIADILPVEMVAGDRAIDDKPFSPALVPEATHHPLVELVPRLADNLAAWASLEPLAGTNVIASAKQGAQVLLRHSTLTGQDGAAMPVLVVGTPGRGRSMVLSSDSSFRWGITTAGRTGDASAYDRFWDRGLRWLGRDPLLDPARISTDREHYGPGAKLRATVLLRDARYQPFGQRAFRLSLLDDRGQAQREIAIETDAEGRANAELPAPAVAGAYSLVVREEGAAEPLAEEVFVVEAGGDELADPRARPQLLGKLADVTGGRALRDVTSVSLDDLPRTRSRMLGTHVTKPFATPWFFACFVAVFGLEWWLRRRFGLR